RSRLSSIPLSGSAGLCRRCPPTLSVPLSCCGCRLCRPSRYRCPDWTVSSTVIPGTHGDVQGQRRSNVPTASGLLEAVELVEGPIVAALERSFIARQGAEGGGRTHESQPEGRRRFVALGPHLLGGQLCLFVLRRVGDRDRIHKFLEFGRLALFIRSRLS